jgi:hypothetical protein
MVKADIVTAARAELREPVASLWGATILEAFHDIVIREISYGEPLLTYVNLPIIEYTTSVDVSALTDLIKLYKVESPVGNIQTYGWLGLSEIALDISIPTITDGTLAGTITFTQNSRAVTGSGTAFTSRAYGSSGDLICLHDGTKYYQIAYITSDTALTLSEPFAETTHTDDAAATLYRTYDSVARLTYGAAYTVSTATNMPLRMDDIAIKGIVAKAASSYLGDYNKTDSETELDAADTDITSAATNADTYNEGGDLSPKYTQMAATRAAIAQQRIAKSRDFQLWAATKIQEYKEALKTIGRQEFIYR